MFPYYLSIGMTYEQYWNSSPYLVKAYQKAYEIKLEQQNQLEWLQGLYVYNAVSVIVANVLAKKGSKRVEYLEKPLDILPKTEEKKKQEQQEARDKLIKSLTAWKEAWDKRNNNGTNRQS